MTNQNNETITYGQMKIALDRPELAFALMPETSGGPLPMLPEPTPAVMQAVTAAVLRQPVRDVEIVKSVGRFFLVSYFPLGKRDPDMMLAMSMGASRRFWPAIRAFQEARRWRLCDTWENWYERVGDAARLVLSPLGELNPHQKEARFVIEWLIDCASTGRRIE